MGSTSRPHPECARTAGATGVGGGDRGSLTPPPAPPPRQVRHQQSGAAGGGGLHDRLPERRHAPAEDARHRLAKEVLPDDRQEVRAWGGAPKAARGSARGSARQRTTADARLETTGAFAAGFGGQKPRSGVWAGPVLSGAVRGRLFHVSPRSWGSSAILGVPRPTPASVVAWPVLVRLCPDAPSLEGPQ